MKILHFTDIHNHPYNEFSRPSEEGRTTLLDEHRSTYLWIANVILTERPGLVVNGGDTVHTIGFADALTLMCVDYGDRVIRDACREVGCSYKVVLGNHDMGNEATRTHVLPFIKDLITEPEIQDGIFYFPYYRDWEPVWKRYKSRAERCSMAFIHLAVQNAWYNSSHVSDTGIAWSEFPYSCQVVAGHFHHPQVVSPNFMIPGAVCFRDFKDDVVPGMPRGITIFDTDRRESLGLKFVKKIPNPCTSIYRSIKVQSEQDLQIALAGMEDLDRTYLRVVFPDHLEPFVNQIRDVRGIKKIPLRVKRSTLVGSSETDINAYDPVSVLTAYEKSNPSLDSAKYIQWVQELVADVLGSMDRRSQHHTQMLSLHAENFMSYRNLDVRFVDGLLVYVDGVIQDLEADTGNGAGKSAVFEAIHWCLTNKLIRSGKTDEGKVNVDDVVNDQVGAGCMVSLSLEVDKVEYQVLRSRKHPTHGDDLKIWREGELISEGRTASRKSLDNLTGMFQGAMFRHTSFLVDSLSTRFSLLTGGERSKLLEDVVQLSSYDKLYRECHERYKEASKARLFRVNEVDNLETQIRSLQEELQHQQELRATQQQRLDSQIESKRSQIHQNNQELEALRATVVDTSELETWKGQRATLQVGAGTWSNKESTTSIMQLTTLIATTQAELRQKESLQTGVCPTCLRPFTVGPNIAQDIEVLRTRLQEYQTSQQQWIEYERSCLRACEDARKQVAALDEKIHAVESQRHVASSKIQMIVDQNSRLEQDIQQLQNSTSEFDSMLRSTQEKIRHTESLLVASKDERDKLEMYFEMVSYWDEALYPGAGVRTMLMRGAVAQLADLAVDYANFVSNGRVSPRLELNDAGEITFDVSVVGGYRKYGLSSSGQRRMVDIGIQLALAKLASRYSGFSCNLLVLDEIDDKLDAAARRHLMALLERIAGEDRKMIMIASHSKDLKTHAHETWLVTNVGGVSTLQVAA